MASKYVHFYPVVEAVQWTGENNEEIVAFHPESFPEMVGVTYYMLVNTTRNGLVGMTVGDWIVGNTDEVKVMENNKFRDTYKLLEEAKNGERKG